MITMPTPKLDPRTSPETKPFRMALLKLLNEFDASIVGYSLDCNDATLQIETIRLHRKLGMMIGSTPL